MAVPDLNLKK
jgi:hypothetical protein